MKRFIFFTFCFFTFFSLQTLASDPDTLRIIEAAREPLGAPPEEWEHILPKKHRVYTTYSIDRSIDGQYLRIRSNSSDSWLELALDAIDVAKYNVMEWQWKVDKFPKLGFEQENSNDDFAIRIELIYDFKSDYKNPLNILRKGFFTSVFKWYPPELIVSYVWSINVPTEKPYVSPNSDYTIVMPIVSNDVVKNRWLKERREIGKDLVLLYQNHKLYLKKIRIRSDTRDSLTSAESGLKYIYLITEKPSDDSEAQK